MTAGLEREAVVGLLPIRALIVHAEDSPQRVENVRRLTAYLAGVGLEAVDVFPAVRPPDPGPLYSAGEFGCYQSHGGCLHAAAAQPEHVITMVIEDDVEFSISAARLREVLEDAVGREWDLLYLGHSGWSPVRSWDRDLLAEPWLQVRGMIYGTTCYMVRPRGFARLADDYDELAWESPQTGGWCRRGWRIRRALLPSSGHRPPRQAGSPCGGDRRVAVAHTRQRELQRPDPVAVHPASPVAQPDRQIAPAGGSAPSGAGADSFHAERDDHVGDRHRVLSA